MTIREINYWFLVTHKIEVVVFWPYITFRSKFNAIYLIQVYRTDYFLNDQRYQHWGSNGACHLAAIAETTISVAYHAFPVTAVYTW